MDISELTMFFMLKRVPYNTRDLKYIRAKSTGMSAQLISITQWSWEMPDLPKRR